MKNYAIVVIVTIFVTICMLGGCIKRTEEKNVEAVITDKVYHKERIVNKNKKTKATAIKPEEYEITIQYRFSYLEIDVDKNTYKKIKIGDKYPAVLVTQYDGTKKYEEYLRER